MKPRFNMYCLHSLQGQFFGCHFLITFLKAFRLVNSFSCKGTISEIFGPRIMDKIFGTKWSNPVRKEKTGKEKLDFCFCVFFNGYSQSLSF